MSGFWFLDFSKVGKFAAFIERLNDKSASGGFAPDPRYRLALDMVSPHFQIPSAVCSRLLTVGTLLLLYTI